MNRAETGRRGEAAAARWYQKQGAQLLAHNYHTRMGELDLVLREPDGSIVICEVKTRSQGMLQRPAAAEDPAKQHRLSALHKCICSRPAKAKNRCVLTLQR